MTVKQPHGGTMKKLLIAITILLVLSACSMLAQAPAPTTAPSPALSADERHLIVSEAEKRDQQFIMRVYLLDIASGKVTSTLDLWGESAALVSDEALSARVLLAPDGSTLWLVNNLMRTQPTRRD